MMLPQIDGPSENSSMVDNSEYHRTGGRPTRQGQGKVTIEMLPEEILLEIFSFYVFGSYTNWQILVHVCQRWRSIVFAAPRHLNLRLFCTGRTPTRKMLDIWPEFPIAVCVRGRDDEINDNVHGALEKPDRICEVYVDHVSAYEIEELVAEAMPVTFPALTHLDLEIDIIVNPTEWDRASFPESFLGGSAPNLRSLRLVHITFWALPKLLLSSPCLVNLTLIDIPYPYPEPIRVSIDAMVDCLSPLTRLEHLQIDFQTSEDHPDEESQRPPTVTRIVFPVLHTLLLAGEIECLDQLLAHIEAPYLNEARLEFLDPESDPSMHIMFPELLKLLLSSPGLVTLSLFNIPCPEYISADAIVDCLSSLTRLERLEIEFPPSPPHPDSAGPHPPILTRTVFPVLSTLLLEGDTEDLDHLSAHIEAPHLNDVHFKFIDPPNFGISRISSCIGPMETFEAFDQAYMRFSGVNFVRVMLSSRKETTDSKRLILSLILPDLDWKLVTLTCRPSSHPFHFHLTDDGRSPRWAKNMGIILWLELLHVFATVENLYLSTRLALHIAPALQGLAEERVTEVLQELTGKGVTEFLPALQTIFIQQRKPSEAKTIQEVMGEFVSTRELSGHPVTVKSGCQQY